ncbi:MAG: type II secretion system F family protein [Bryobacteraceae bacterium]|nr:type II secretion system F family protein [Bryobacteraceae bacterium]
MAILSALFFFAITFLLIAIAVVAGWLVIGKSWKEQSEELARENEGADEPSIFRDEQLSTISVWDGLLKRFNFVQGLKSQLEQAELDWSVGRLTSLMLLASTVTLAILVNVAAIPVWVALGGGALAGSAPYLYLRRKRAKRFRKFQEEFPDALDSAARCLRAGYPFATAMEMVAVEASSVVGVELRRTAAEASLGMAWSQALENLGRRVPLLEVNLFVSAVQLHARTGGRLGEVMSGLAETMRENVALTGEVRALAAHGKLTGLVLSMLPVFIAGVMTYVNPGYMKTLVDHPIGKDLIAAALGCLVLAHLVIRKIVDIKI